MDHRSCLQYIFGIPEAHDDFVEVAFSSPTTKTHLVALFIVYALSNVMCNSLCLSVGFWSCDGDAENARHENARNAIVWNTECCICLFIAAQECMSRQERAPDFAADCVLVDD